MIGVQIFRVQHESFFDGLDFSGELPFIGLDLACKLRLGFCAFQVLGKQGDGLNVEKDLKHKTPLVKWLPCELENQLIGMFFGILIFTWLKLSKVICKILEARISYNKVLFIIKKRVLDS